MESPVLPTGGEGREIDAVMKNLNMVPLDPTEDDLDISSQQTNFNRPSGRLPR